MKRFALACGIAAACALAPAAGASEARREVVDPWVVEQIDAGGSAEMLVVLSEQADLSGARALATKEAKGALVFERLTEVAARTQAPLLAALRSAGVEHRSFWIANMVWVRGDVTTLDLLTRRAEVGRILPNPAVTMKLPGGEPEGRESANGIEPNLSLIGAPDYWARGFTGQGIVVAGQDTGYDWDHPALIGKYRGWNGSSADHSYNWHDAIHSGGGVCGADSPEPCDDDSHGTHTMGTMVGDDGGANQVGVAPGARWIGCRNMDRGTGTPASYAECFQFFVAPTDGNDQNPDPALAPHVINNSWGCPPSEGCTDPLVLESVVANTRAAGIEVVVSAGNEGPFCGSVGAPPAIYASSFSVGATTDFDTIAAFSSRGPVSVDGSGRMKPNVSAPGTFIRSSVPGGGYSGTFSGTSMAGPHVAGQVALLLSAKAELVGDPDAIETCIEDTALPLTTSQSCGGVPGSEVPNNTFGYGRIQMLWPPCGGAGECTDADGDGYGAPGDPGCAGGSETDCDDADPSVNPGAVEIPGDGVDNDCDPSTPPQTGCNPEPEGAVSDPSTP